VPLAQVAPALPGDLVAIVSRAMARDPAERYVVAGELAADLRRFQTGQLVAAHVYSRRELVARFVRRHRAAVTLSALFVLLLGAGGALSVRKILAESERVAVQRARAERERGGAEDLVQFLLSDQRSRLEGVGRLDLLGSVCDRVDSYYRTFAAERALEPEDLVKRAALAELRASVAIDSGNVVAGDTYLSAALALLDRVPALPSGLEVRARVLGSLSVRAQYRGALTQARTHFEEAAALYARASAPGGNRRGLDAARARMLLGAGTMADHQGEGAKAEAQWGEARRVLEGLLVGHPEDHGTEASLVDALIATGRGRLLRGQFAEADEPLRAAVAHAEAITRAEPRRAPFRYSLSHALSTLADARSAAGDAEESRTLQERARQVAAELVALEPANARWHTAVAETARELGRAAGMRGDWANATKYLGEASGEYEHLLELDPKNLSIHQDAAISFGMLADCETFAHHIDAARARWQDSLRHLEIIATAAPGERLEWAFGLQGYSQLQLSIGDLKGAAESIDKALGIVLSTPTGKDRPQQVSHRAWVLTQLGQVREAQHREPEAKLYFQQAATLFQSLAQRHALQAGWREPIEVLRHKARWVEQP
jgi:tetratricopeptide (TPR) repeat protein